MGRRMFLENRVALVTGGTHGMGRDPPDGRAALRVSATAGAMTPGVRRPHRKQIVGRPASSAA
jgi:hypothetical protein